MPKVGYRFRPTEQELLGYFLYHKITENSILDDDEDEPVKVCDLYGDQEPWNIWNFYGGKYLLKDEALYFFTQLKRKSPKASRYNRKIASGAWQGEDAAKSVMACDSDEIIGFKKRFRYENSNNSEQNGRWIMYEYTINSSFLGEQFSHKATDYVLCCIKKNESVQQKEKDSLVKKQRKLKQVDGKNESVQGIWGKKRKSYQGGSTTTNNDQNKRSKIEEENILIPLPEAVYANNVPEVVESRAETERYCDPSDVEDLFFINQSTWLNSSSLTFGIEELLSQSPEDDCVECPINADECNQSQLLRAEGEEEFVPPINDDQNNRFKAEEETLLIPPIEVPYTNNIPEVVHSEVGTDPFGVEDLFSDINPSTWHNSSSLTFGINELLSQSVEDNCVECPINADEFNQSQLLRAEREEEFIPPTNDDQDNRSKAEEETLLIPPIEVPYTNNIPEVVHSEVGTDPFGVEDLFSDINPSTWHNSSSLTFGINELLSQSVEDNCVECPINADDCNQSQLLRAEREEEFIPPTNDDQDNRSKAEEETLLIPPIEVPYTNNVPEVVHYEAGTNPFGVEDLFFDINPIAWMPPSALPFGFEKLSQLDQSAEDDCIRYPINADECIQSQQLRTEGEVEFVHEVKCQAEKNSLLGEEYEGFYSNQMDQVVLTNVGMETLDLWAF